MHTPLSASYVHTCVYMCIDTVHALYTHTCKYIQYWQKTPPMNYSKSCHRPATPHPHYHTTTFTAQAQVHSLGTVIRCQFAAWNQNKMAQALSQHSNGYYKCTRTHSADKHTHTLKHIVICTHKHPCIPVNTLSYIATNVLMLTIIT